LVRQTARGSLILLIGQILSNAILAIAIVLVARFLGATRYGEYTVVMVPVGIATLLMDLGTNSSLTRSIASRSKDTRFDENRQLILSGLFLNLGMATLISIIIFIFSSQISTIFLKKSELDYLLKIASFSIVGQALINTTEAVFIGLNKMEIISFNGVLFAILKGVSAPLLVYFGLGSIGMVYSQTIMILLTGFVSLLFLIRFLKINMQSSFKNYKGSFKELIINGIPFYLSALVSNGIGQIYNSLMVLYISLEQIGNYGASQNFVVLISFLTIPIATSLFPLFSRIPNNDPRLQEAYQDSVKYSSIFALPGVFALLALSDSIIRTFLGTSYPLTSLYLRLSLISYLMLGVGSLSCLSFLNGQGKAYITLRMNIISLIIGASIAFFLIPSYGIFGLLVTANIATIISYAYGILWIKKYFGIFIDKLSSIKIYISSFTPFLVTLVVITFIQTVAWIRMMSGAIVFVIFYLIMLKFTKVLNEKDYRILRIIIGDNKFFIPIIKAIDIFEKI
jgi:O-antigen/teichoic acid export membrane protein